MNFTNLVVLSGVEEDTLGSGSLSRVNVGHDSDIAVILEGELSFLCRRIERTR